MKKKNKRFPDFDLVPNSSGIILDSSGIILDSIWIKKDKSEIIIVSVFGGEWHYKQLSETEKSI